MKTKPFHGNCQKLSVFPYVTVFHCAPRFAVNLESAFRCVSKLCYHKVLVPGVETRKGGRDTQMAKVIKQRGK